MRVPTLAPAVSRHSIPALVSLVHEGVTVGYEFGLHSLGALARVAETVEESVYAAHSLEATESGLRFSLWNPPLRLGAFGSANLRVNGTPVPPAQAQVRKVAEDAWTSLDRVTPEAPLVWLPDEPREFEARVGPVPAGEHVTVRLELRNVAIPPLVWIEIRGAPRVAR